MKTLSLLFLFLINTTCTDPKTVYICGSGKTHKYHLTDKCRGLNNCQYKILQTTLDKAKKEGKTLCGWED